ncbi:MAG: HEAT repeat domain-containing protein [Planctomycetaceae bacterium]
MTDSPRGAMAPNDSLPPVEPPSAGFLVQLFLVPAVIVGIIVAVWVAFHWLAQLGNDPEGYLKALRRQSEGRWQAALNFANDLRGPGGAALKGDGGLAGELGSILTDEVASGRPRVPGDAGEPSRTLCIYLCRALGEFAVPEAAPPLVARAADETDRATARAAVAALAVLAANLRAAGRAFPDGAAVVAAVGAASRSDDDALRSAAAFTLGVIGGDEATARLGELLADGSDNARFNAAVGLARAGRPAAWDTLGEMLALPDVEARAGDEVSQSSRYKRTLVVVNALIAVGKIVDTTRQPPPDPVVAAIARLAEDPVANIRDAARGLIGKIDRISAPGAGKR